MSRGRSEGRGVRCDPPHVAAHELGGEGGRSGEGECRLLKSAKDVEQGYGPSVQQQGRGRSRERRGMDDAAKEAGKNASGGAGAAADLSRA